MHPRGSFVIAAMIIGGCGSSSPPAAGPSAPAPAAPPISIPLLDDRAALDAWADRELGRLPSAVIAVVDRDGLRWWRGVGSRDLKGGPPPDAQTVYRIGSITKVLTGTAVLQLRDAGALSLDDAAGTWIPELAARLEGVTLRHLVTHTSGVPSIGDHSAPYWEQTPPTLAQMLRALDVPLEFPPGSKTAYSNAGMALAGVVVERAARMPWRDYAAKHLLAPLGMRSAAWDRGAVPVDRLAIGVAHEGLIDPPHWQLGAFEPAGGLYASTDDMAGLARLALGAFPDVLAPASLAAATTDDPLPGPHGVAWVVGQLDGTRLLGHGGSTSDYSSAFAVLPDRGVAVVILHAGPDTTTSDCVSVALLRATIGAPLGTCGTTPVDEVTAARAHAALDRFRALLAAPTDAGLDAVFTPAFLEGLGRQVILTFLERMRTDTGPCDRQTLEGASGPGVRGALHCAKRSAGFELLVEDAPPHRIASMRIF